MTNPEIPQLDRILSSLAGRVVLVILTGVVAAGALSLVFGLGLPLSIYLLSGLMLTGLGLTTGLAARLLLRGSTFLLQLLSASVALLMGLWIVSLISRGALGLDLVPGSAGGPTWAGVLQVFWSGLVTWLTLRAWRASVRLKEAGTPKPGRKPAKRATRSGSGPRLPRLKIPGLKMPFKFPENGFGKLTSKISWPLRWPSKPETRPGRRVRIGQPAKGRQKIRAGRKRHPKPIRLVGEVEHICPFCLESVSKKDPRGYKICSTCKTWHHADCWDVTGECQVPHHH